MATDETDEKMLAMFERVVVAIEKIAVAQERRAAAAETDAQNMDLIQQHIGHAVEKEYHSVGR